MKNVLLALSMLVLISTVTISPSIAQGRVNPKELPKVEFYMARQQVQILDNTPAVNDLRTNPQPGQQNAAAASRLGAGLPRAGFSSNMGAYHGGPSGSALPQVNNGVPKSLPQTINGVNNGLKAGNAGKLSKKMAIAPKQAGTPVVKSYKQYATTPVVQNSGASTGTLLNSSSNVKGSVLHWNRHH